MIRAEDSALEIVLRPDKANGKMMAMSSGIFQWSASNNPAAVPLSLFRPTELTTRHGIFSVSSNLLHALLLVVRSTSQSCRDQIHIFKKVIDCLCKSNQICFGQLLGGLWEPPVGKGIFRKV